MGRFSQKRFWLRAAGMVVGLINLLGSEAAWETGGRAEPARYLVAAIVLFLSGIFWLAYSLHPKLELSNFNYTVIASIMLVGPFLGLLYSFKFYGGECGFTSKYGYPGYWLNNWKCTYISSTALWEGRWSMDYYSLIADLFFWSGTGLLLSLLWGRFKSKSASVNSSTKRTGISLSFLLINHYSQVYPHVDEFICYFAYKRVLRQCKLFSQARDIKGKIIQPHHR